MRNLLNWGNEMSKKNRVDEYITQGTPDEIRERYCALKELAELSDYGDLDRDLVVIDTETTGVSFEKDELTQIAAARLEKGEITEWFVTFVNPGKHIPEDISHLTNIYDSDVESAPDPITARRMLADFVGSATCVAHNAAFDFNFCTKGQGGEPLKENLWIDSLDMARIALPRLTSHRLIDLVKAFDCPISTHRADADVEALCAVYRILLAAIETMPYELVRYIGSLATPDQWPTGVVFELISRNMAAKTENSCACTIEPPNVPLSIRHLRKTRVFHDKQPVQNGNLENSIGNDPESAPHNALGKMNNSLESVLEFPTPEELDEAYTPEGIVGRMYEGFEPRREQVVMAQKILSAYATNTNLTVEAGTGVGKSMAYLLPSAIAALRSEATFGIATKTNALLDQVMYKELPLLADALQDAGYGTLRYVSLKGFSHYPCLRMVEKLTKEPARQVTYQGKEYSQAPSIAALLSFIEQTCFDDLDGLKIDYHTLPRYSFCVSSQDCLRRKCPYYNNYCFVHGLRKQAETAHVVVTNHALFFCDLAMDGGLLPPARYWVVDEAHGAESEARRALAVNLDAQEMLRLAYKMESDEARRNPFLRAERVVNTSGDEFSDASTLFYGLTEKARSAGKEFAARARDLCASFKGLLSCEAAGSNKGYETIELWINDKVRASAAFKCVRGCGREFIGAAERLINSGNELVAYLESEDGVQEVQREIAVVVMEAKEMLQSCDMILEQASPAYVYSAKLHRKSDRLVDCLTAQPVDVGEILNETLYEQTNSVVYTSATISVGEDFRVFESAMGLNRTESSQAGCCMLGSSYDFNTNMQVLVIQDIPEPNQPGYLEALSELLTRVHVAQQGSMLTLFTNRREMETCFASVDPRLKEAGLRLICQKWGVSNKGLRDDFLKDTSISLFALKSFWEGFDAPGATLRGVVIPKLPFAKPTDPLSCERATRDSAAWSHYILPQAIIEVKQAAGRLIRTSTDKGVLILADKRLLTKGYGRLVLRSLPSRNITTCSTDEAVEILRRSIESA